MKRIAKNLISIINHAAVKIMARGIKISNSVLFLSSLKSQKNNSIHVSNSKINNSKAIIEGQRNSLTIKNSDIAKTSILIQGNGNSITIAQSACIRGSTLIIKGTNCSIHIGEETLFGGVRIVNVGTNCSVKIGKNCMFSDHIEIWPSDSHPIYDENHIMINPEASIIIGDNVWIGAHARILKGVSIGDGSVVGMGCTVTKNIPSNVVSIGSPNRTVKEKITWEINYPAPIDSSTQNSPQATTSIRT